MGRSDFNELKNRVDILPSDAELWDYCIHSLIKSTF